MDLMSLVFLGQGTSIIHYYYEYYFHKLSKEGDILLNRTRKGIAAIVIAIFLCLLFILAFDTGIHTEHYDLESEKIKAEVKIAFISDFHGSKFGKSQSQVMGALNREEPDYVLLGGDIFDDTGSWDPSIELLSEIRKKYVAYFTTGNHEFNTRKVDEIKEIVRTVGIEVLDGETIPLKKNGFNFDLSGIDDTRVGYEMMESQLESADSTRREGVFSILIIHNPATREMVKDYGYDLVLSGHYHGGQVRIPFLVEGVYSPAEGFFPDYAGGEYSIGESKLIVSRGLTTKRYPILRGRLEYFAPKFRREIRMPRIFNPPELVIVILKPKG